MVTPTPDTNPVLPPEPPPTLAAAPQAQATQPEPSAKSVDPFYARIFGISASAVLAILLYKIVAPFLGPLIWALFIAFLLHPLYIRLTGRFKGRENLAAGLLTFATFILLIGPLTGMSAAFVSQATDVAHWARDNLGKQTQEQIQTLTDLPLIGGALSSMRDTFGVDIEQAQSWIAQGAQRLPPLLAGLGGKLFLGALGTVFAFVVMLFMLFFFIRDGAVIVALARDLVPMAAERREQLMDHIAAVTRAVVFGTGMTALVQGTLVGIAFLITGISSPLVFGVLAALFALLPIGGTALVWIPALFVLGAQDRWGMAIVMLAFGITSSSIDNVLRPLLISGRAEVGTLTVFIGVLGGTAAFGPVGLFLGPVVLALIIALMRFAQDHRNLPA
jgi:predicted PurR-regulated permease PerM